MTRRRKAGYGLGMLLLCLALAEGGLRLLGMPTAKRDLDALSFPPRDAWGVDFLPHPRRHWQLAPDNQRPWSLFKMQYSCERGQPFDLAARVAGFPQRDYYGAVRWEVNARGFRGPPPREEVRPVLFLGSSVTFGWGVHERDGFVGRLRPRLRERGLEAINAGVPGYSSHQSLLYLRELLAGGLRPAAIVFEAGVNDGVWAPGGPDRQRRADGRGPLARAVRSSHLLLSLFFLLRGRGPAGPSPELAPQAFYTSAMHTPGRSRVSPPEFRANLAAVEALAEQVGADLVILVPGLFNERGAQTLVPAARLDHPRQLDLVSALRAAPAPLDELFLPYDEAHLSPQGHAAVAELLAQAPFAR